MKVKKVKTPKVKLNSNSTKIQNIGKTGRKYLYEKIYYKSPNVHELTREMAEFSAHLIMFLETKLPKKLFSYILPHIKVDRDWLKIEFLSTTPLKAKKAIRDFVVNSDFVGFYNKKYTWSTETDSRAYIAIGPGSCRKGKSWTVTKGKKIAPIYIK